MSKKGDSNFKLISKYVSGALKLEFTTDGGKINFYSFLGAMILALLVLVPTGLIDIGNAIYSYIKLEQLYEAKINFLPLFVASIIGMLCVLLMGILFKERENFNKDIEEIGKDD